MSGAPTRPSSGCSTTLAPVPGATTLTITSGATERTYRQYLPDNPGAKPLPIVINLHGLTSNIAQQVAITAFEPLAESEKFLVLTPQALGTPTHWDSGDTADNADVAFIAAMLDQAEADVCVDTARVYSTGISDGGIMSSVLACRLASRIAAVGLVSGIKHPASCDGGRAVPMIVFWGKKDVVLPYCGGLGPIVSALMKGLPLVAVSEPVCPPASFSGFPPVEEVVGGWVTSGGCSPTPDVLPAGAGVEERVFAGCRDGAGVRFFVVSDGGHTWPGSKVMQALSASGAASIIGFTTDAVDATRLIWHFFRGYALDAP